jgi:phage major head subunit gpT-like protein
MPGRSEHLSSPAIIGTFFHHLEGAFERSWVRELGMYFRSTQEIETYNWIGQSPAVREWIGSRLAKNLREFGLSLKNKTWELTLRLDIDQLRRDKTGQMIIRVIEASRRINTHWAKRLSTLMINGETTTSGLAYDGQKFFDTDHSEGESGVQKNLLTYTEVPYLAVAAVTMPTQEEMANAILGGINYMLGLKDDQGEPLHEEASNFMVMTGLRLAPVAAAACVKQTVARASGAVTDNPLQGSTFKVTQRTNARLTDALGWDDEFVIFRTDGDVKPFILQEELPPTMSSIGAGSELEHRENAHEYGIKMINDAGYGDWRFAAKCRLSTALGG